MYVVESRALHWFANGKNNSKADLIDCWRSNFFQPQKLRGCQVTRADSFLPQPAASSFISPLRYSLCWPSTVISMLMLT